VAADMSKTLRVAFAADVTGFDPQVTQDVYSAYIERAIFDRRSRTTTWRVRTRSSRTPRRAAEIRDGGRTIIVRIKPGIFFTPDPAFNGKKRELTAETMSTAGSA
jgi:hypothetical protein